MKFAPSRKMKWIIYSLAVFAVGFVLFLIYSGVTFQNYKKKLPELAVRITAHVTGRNASAIEGNLIFESGVVELKQGRTLAGIMTLAPLADRGHEMSRELIWKATMDESRELFGRSLSGDQEYVRARILQSAPAEAAAWYFIIADGIEQGVLEVQGGQTEAYLWYVAAAELGHKESQSIVYRANLNGWYGLAPDREKAARWRARYLE